ncbi:hypothetical protein H9P43_009156 [Blastocladiella emersonii ATCC 22665]|nr:hypothetical protein H9P43_009156 [Blastocladiella emersonii ATCC 22665]
MTGSAPEVTLGAYRIFGCKGGTSTELILQGMTAAFKDGMDIINMSLGGGSSFFDYSTAIAASRLADKGLVVMSALGNDGAQGLFHAAAPGVALNGFGVGSFDNAKALKQAVKVEGVAGLTSIPANTDARPKGAFKTGDKYVVKPSPDPATIPNDACAPFPAGFSFEGKTALLRRGTCAYTVKIENAVAAGAKSIVFFNNQPTGVWFGGFAEDSVFPVPVGFVSPEAGTAIKAAVEKGAAVTLEFTPGQEPVAVQTAGQPSDFSLREHTNWRLAAPNWQPTVRLDWKPMNYNAWSAECVWCDESCPSYMTETDELGSTARQVVAGSAKRRQDV